MNRPSHAQMERARQLLAHESAAGSADARDATAAGRVYDKLHDRMALLVGAVGVQLLFVRSAKLSQSEFPCLAEVKFLEGSTNLHECLQAQDPAVATEAAAALFGTFFALMTTFIGERLTTQILRNAWPAIEDAAPRETRK